MNIQEHNDGFNCASVSAVVLFAVVTTAIFFPGRANSQEIQPSTAETHMSEALRSSLQKVVVLPGTSPAKQGVAGSFEKPTPGLITGMKKGSELGDGVSKEIGGIVFRQRIPILTYPGAILGGLSGKLQREIQDFRDGLTEDLAQASSQPLSNDALASDVFWGLRNVPGLDSKIFSLTTPIPDDTDAILYVSLTDITINVEGKDAIITTSAHATLRRMDDGNHVYDRVVQYQDRDRLSNWTKNDNAAWHDYASFARHYIGREISAEAYERIALQHTLRPRETDTLARVKKNDWRGVTRSLTPTLAWELTLLGGDDYGPWASAIDAADITYDVEIYDRHRLVYAEKRLPDPSHTVAMELEACKTYRWSVRPSYELGATSRFGAWMRSGPDAANGNGNLGRIASEAPAYLQDFATFEIKCGRR